MNTGEEETLNESAESSTAKGATAESPAANPTDANRGPSSSSQGAKTPGSLAEALDQAKLEQPEEEAPGKEGAAAKGSPANEKAESEKDESDDAGNKDEPPAAKDKADDSATDLFHKRPEWAELNKALGDENAKKARPIIRNLMEREHRAEEQIRTLRPVVDELKAHTGNEQGFQTMRNIVKAYATDPGAAVPILENMLNDARSRAGLSITSDDLKAKVTRIREQVRLGELETEEAQAREAELIEIEKARAAKNRAENRAQQNERERQGAAAKAAETQTLNAINSWENNLRERDPDFGDVTDVADPKHGESVADRVFDALCLKRLNNPRSTADELLGEAKRVYELARRQLPRAPLRTARTVTAGGSSITAKPKPRNMREAMDTVKLDMPA